MHTLSGTVLSVSLSARHTFSKAVQPRVRILAGLGVEGDAHAGETVRHRYLVRRNPNTPNLAQVHLLAAELFAELAPKGIALTPGAMGENVTTAGLDLLLLPLGTRLHLGAEAVVELSGLRTPCKQMDALHPGLMAACLVRHGHGQVERRAGVMALALRTGTVEPGDPIAVELPPEPHRPLGPV